MQAEVKDLKAQLPGDEEAKASSPLQGQIKELESVRPAHHAVAFPWPMNLCIDTARSLA